MKKYIVIIGVLILVVAWVAYSMYNKPHRDPTSESSVEITATELFRKYEENETEANALYLDKVLAVSGKVAEVTTNQEMMPVVILETENPMFGVSCTMENGKTTLQIGDVVTIKGICTGYLSDVVIIKGTLNQ
jgi:tRNA_anti-like